MPNADEPPRKRRIPGVSGVYDEEAELLLSMEPEEIVRRWVIVQEALQDGGAGSYGSTYLEAEDALMDMNDEFGVELLTAYMNSESVHARRHAPNLVELLPYVDREELAISCLGQLADDPDDYGSLIQDHYGGLIDYQLATCRVIVTV